MGLRLITPPAAEPVSLAEVKADMRPPVEHNDDDATLQRFITRARESIDGPRTWFARSIMPQTWEVSLDAFPTSEILLPTAPVQSIVGVYYDDADGVQQEVAGADYYLDDAQEPPWLIPVAGGWSVSPMSAANAVRVRFISGYADADAVPGPIKEAIRLMVQEKYDGTDNADAIAASLGQFRLYL
jgi:uncharacterized phiE125 gp8 family phage protein